MDHYQYITNESERKSGKHLTSEDRGAIQAMKKLKYSNRKIAAYLHCSPTTVSNELKRGTPEKKSGRGRKAGHSAKRGIRRRRLDGHQQAGRTGGTSRMWELPRDLG